MLVAGAWGVLIVIYIAMVAGVWASVRLPFRSWLLPALVGGYLVVVQAGADAYSRYRYPIMPFIAFFGGIGAVRLAKAVTARRVPTTPRDTVGTAEVTGAGEDTWRG